MDTVLTTSVDRAAAFLRRGELVAFPTETVYGLGADAMREDAVGRIFEAKGRPLDNPLIVHVWELAQIERIAREIPPAAEQIIARCFPGPLTVVLPRHPDLPRATTAGLDTVAVRMPSGHITRSFLKACLTPVAAPSANRSGRPSPTTWQDVIDDLGGRIACVLQGPQSSVGVESTVVDCTGSDPVLLRPGAVALETLQEIAPSTRPAPSQDALLERSPGTRHRHYAPSARVVLVDRADEAHPADASAAFIGLDVPSNADAYGACLQCSGLDQYAFELYHFFRRCDQEGITTIFCQRVQPTGLGRAILDRIHRAAQSGGTG